MDNKKIGELISSKEKQNGLTQQQQSEKQGLSSDELLDAKTANMDTEKAQGVHMPGLKTIITVLIPALLSSYLFLFSLSGLINRFFIRTVYKSTSSPLDVTWTSLAEYTIIMGFECGLMLLCIGLFLLLFGYKTSLAKVVSAIMLPIGIIMYMRAGILNINGAIYIVTSLCAILLAYNGANLPYKILYWLSLCVMAAILVSGFKAFGSSIGSQLTAISMGTSNIFKAAFWISFGLAVKSTNKYLKGLISC